MLKEAVEKSRSLSHDLSPAVLYQGDLGQTFEWLARRMKTQHGLTVRVNSDGGVNLESDAMRAFLYKTGQELLFNVVKHARVQEATLRLRRFGRYVALAVADRGRGFDPQGLKAAAGFGLFSIRERVELLGGHMKIRSAAGQGSTFLVVVPDDARAEDGRQRIEDRRQTTDDRGQQIAPSSVFCPPSSHRTLRVLLADDHEVVRQGLKGILRDEPDMEVVGEAANGREAVDLAWRLKPDVVIMDVAMPLINGDEATRQVKRHLPQTRVIALSMYDEPERIESMRRAGAEAYVLKTAPSEELLVAIRGPNTMTG
jgi:CheY-like chemotaxis protein